MFGNFVMYNLFIIFFFPQNLHSLYNAPLSLYFVRITIIYITGASLRLLPKEELAYTPMYDAVIK